MLNQEQLQASSIQSRYSLILAGPGTGKTTALVGRFSHLLKNGIQPQTILCCTFAKKAADEIGSRIQLETGINSRGLSIGTFHALARRLLKVNGSAIGVQIPEKVLSDKERLNKVFEIKKSLNGGSLYKDFDNEASRPSAILKYIDAVREELLDPEDASIEASENGETLNILHAEVYKHYEKWISESGNLDFPRMLQMGCKLLAHDAEYGCKISKRYSHILVDEYQDINKAQKIMVDGLLKGGASLWVVGDDDQAIYGWRGSKSHFILDFDKNYPGTEKVALIKNYRSGKEVVSNANDLIQHAKYRHAKTIVSENGLSSNVHIVRCRHEKAEADRVLQTIKQRIKTGISVEDVAVLSRTNLLPATVIDTLIAHEIPVILKDGIQLFADLVAQDLLSAVALASDIKPENGWNRRLPKNIESFAKKISKDEWPIKVKALATLFIKHSPLNLSEQDLASRISSIEYYKDYLLSFEEAAEVFKRVRRSMQQPKDGKGVHVGTIHKAKGLEWDSVFVIGWEDDMLPHGLNHSQKGIEEERRVAYVAVTRPKNFLMMTYVEKRQGDEKKYSRFLDEMPNATDSGTERADQKTSLNKSKPKKTKIVDPLDALTKKYRKLFPESDVLDKELASIKPQVSKKIPVTHSDNIGSTRNSAQDDRAFYQEVNKILQQKKLSKNIADGSGRSVLGTIDADDGLLKDAGYNAQKDGPSSGARQKILTEIFEGKIGIPAELKESVAEQWGEPKSIERLQKLRGQLNFFLGTQKGRTEPSKQAIDKWTDDLSFIDRELINLIESGER